MKVYAEPPIENFCMDRICRALKKYAPKEILFLNKQEEADLIIIYAHGLRKSLWWQVSKIKYEDKKCAVIQLQLKNTVNPSTYDWLDIWRKADLVWSYYDLPSWCAEEGNPAIFNFYHAPLGVDSSLFVESEIDKKYTIGIHSKGWSRESLREVVTAARNVGGKVLVFDDPKDYGEGVEFTGIIKDNDSKMAHFYSQCKYIAGLRRVEGFELPVIEGLMCGARPVCYDIPSYRIWFNGLAEFVSDEGRDKIIPALENIFRTNPRPVTLDEKEFVKNKFNWETIAHGFWKHFLR